jgi:hypothetical protein
MAIEKLVRRTCDRCRKVIDESAPAPVGEAAEKATPVFYLNVNGIQSDPSLAKKGESIVFDDLCTKCCERVLSLKSQITLEKADVDDKSSETLDAGPKPKDNKGSKSAEAKSV